MNHDEFKEMFDFGVPGEKVAGSWLGAQKVTHFPLHSLGSLKHGPRVTMADGTTLACPDFICWGLPPKIEGAPDQFFIEVKRFRKWWNTGSNQQTGIEEGKVVEYRRLAEDTGKKVFIYFLHLNEWMKGDGLFCGDISTLEVAGDTSPDGKKVLMFERADLIHLANEEELAWHAAGE